MCLRETIQTHFHIKKIFSDEKKKKMKRKVKQHKGKENSQQIICAPLIWSLLLALLLFKGLT